MLSLTSYKVAVQDRNGIRFVSSLTFVWVFFCIFLSLGIFHYLKLSPAVYGGYWLALVVFFYFLPNIIFRGIFRYRVLPKGYTPNQIRALEKLKIDVFFESFGNNRTAVYSIYFFVIMPIVGWVLWLYISTAWRIVGIFLGDGQLSVIVDVVALVWCGATSWIIARLVRPEFFKDKRTILEKASHELRYGKYLTKIWIVGFCMWGILGYFLILHFGFDNLLFTIPIYFCGLIVCGIGMKNGYRRR